LLGLFTRFWAIVGSGFLLSVISSQWPGWPGAAPTYYQAVELFALLVLCATAAGRYAGLDFFIHLRIRKAGASGKQGSDQSCGTADTREGEETDTKTPEEMPSSTSDNEPFPESDPQ